MSKEINVSGSAQDIHHAFASFFEEPRIFPYAYWLSRRLQEGHTCLDLGEKNEETASLNAATARKITSLVSDGSTVKPFVLEGNRLYFHRYYDYESQILSGIHRLLHAGQASFAERCAALNKQSALIADLQSGVDDASLPPAELIDWQLITALQAVTGNFTICTGGPGTGKTTTVARILTLLYSIDPTLRITLTAPTGKAAVRMEESLKKTPLKLPDTVQQHLQKLNSSTLHRLLRKIPDSVRFRHDQENPLPYDVIIVDEASMIDAPLFARLLNAVPSDARLIMLGDNNQLASVEAGSVLGDVCKAAGKLNSFTADQAKFLNGFISDKRCQLSSEYFTKNASALNGRVIELQRSRRFTSAGGIGKLSRVMLHNDSAELKKIIAEGQTPEYVIDTTGDPKIFESFIAGYEAFIREPDIATALEKLNQLRVLVTVREGDLGLHAINKKIENFLKSRKLIRTGPEYYENRPVLVTRNNPLLELMNGDVGIVRMDSEKQMRVYFPDAEKGIRAVVPEQLTHVQTLWAMTIHKSQGSEYGQVLVILPDDVDNKLLTRELLYTAITRARDRVVIQGKEEIILAAAATAVKRASGIADRFSAYQSRKS